MPKLTPDYTGQKINKRLVLSQLGYIKGRIYWNVRCDCGSALKCLTQALKQDRCPKCNNKGPRPWKRKRPYESLYNVFVSRTFRKSRSPGAKRPIVEITYEQFLDFTNIKKCHYCGEDVVWTEYRKKGLTTAANLDRKDSDIGYTCENVVVCCPRCNYAKNAHFTYSEWKQLGKVINSWKAGKTNENN